MANRGHLDILKQGVEWWNKWRQMHRHIRPDLEGATLRGANLYLADLTEADLRRADLHLANLRRANLDLADLSFANLTEADLLEASLTHANLEGATLINASLGGATLIATTFIKANLSGAKLYYANLRGADFRDAILTEAKLEKAVLVEANLTGATLTRCSIYGISVWNVKLEGAIQDDLIITPSFEPILRVDNLKIAQFIYLLLDNKEIRDVINTITTKAVLILGRFTPERKAILDALREALRTHGYLPILFDFDKPASRDITETVSTLAHLARFVIADITDAKSIPQELMSIVPNIPSVPVQPLILESQHEYGMFEHFKRYPWVLPVYQYSDQASLLQSFEEKVIDPAEQKAQELAT